MSLPFDHPPSLGTRFTMTRCTPESLPACIPAYYDAFAPTDASYWWPPSRATMEDWMRRRFAAKIRDTEVQHFQISDNDAGGRVVAFSRWTVPPRFGAMQRGYVAYGEPGEGRERVVPAPDMPLAAYDDFFAGLRRVTERWNPDGELLDLSVLCTSPEYQGQGLGAALVKPVLALADEAGISTYLEGLSNAVGMYRKLGFKTVEMLEYDTSLVPGKSGIVSLEVMIREPQGKGPAAAAAA